MTRPKPWPLAGSNDDRHWKFEPRSCWPRMRVATHQRPRVSTKLMTLSVDPAVGLAPLKIVSVRAAGVGSGVVAGVATCERLEELPVHAKMATAAAIAVARVPTTTSGRRR